MYVCMWVAVPHRNWIAVGNGWFDAKHVVQRRAHPGYFCASILSARLYSHEPLWLPEEDEMLWSLRAKQEAFAISCNPIHSIVVASLRFWSTRAQVLEQVAVQLIGRDNKVINQIKHATIHWLSAPMITTTTLHTMPKDTTQNRMADIVPKVGSRNALVIHCFFCCSMAPPNPRGLEPSILSATLNTKRFSLNCTVT
jgi:hypothetical protein